MRTNQSKLLKKGRKKAGKGKGSGKKGRKQTNNRVTRSKRKVMKRGLKPRKPAGSKNKKTKRPDLPKSETSTAASSSELAAPPSTKAPKPKAHKSKRKAVGTPRVRLDGVRQGRINTGKGWVYEVLPNQVYGCRNCRYIFNGCRSCQKEGFRGKTAADMRQEQQFEQNGGWDTWWEGDWAWDEVQQTWVEAGSKPKTKPKKQRSSP